MGRSLAEIVAEVEGAQEPPEARTSLADIVARVDTPLPEHGYQRSEATSRAMIRDQLRAPPRGAAILGEMFADVADIALESRVPAGFAPGLPGLGTKTPSAFERVDDPDVTREARTWAARNVVNPFTEESAGDRLRRAASHAIGLPAITERETPEGIGGPGFEAQLTGLEAFGSSVLGGFSSLPATAASVLGAGGAGMGRYLAEVSNFGPVGTAAAEVIGELMGGASPRTARALRNVASELRRTFGAAAESGTSVRSTANERMALAAVENALVGDAAPEEAAEIMSRIESRIGAGEVSTLPAMAESGRAEGLANLAAARVTGGKEQWRAVNQATEQQAIERLRGARPRGASEDAAALSRAVVERRVGQLGAEEMAALAEPRAAAEAARLRAAASREALPAQPLDVAGRAEAENIAEAKRGLEAAEDRAWAKVPQEVTISTQPIKDDLQATLAKLTPEEQTEIMGPMGRHVQQVMDLPDEVSGQRLIALERVMRRATPVDQQTLDKGRVETVQRWLVDAVKKGLREDPTLGPEFNEAVAWSRSRFERFQNGLVGQIRRATRDLPSTTVNRIIVRGPGGRETAREASNAGARVEDALRAKFLAEATDAQGNITKADAFFKNYEAAFDATPRTRRVERELRELAEAVADEKAAAGALTQAEKDAAKLRKAREKELRAAPQLRAESPGAVEAEMGDLLARKRAPQELRTLMTDARAAGPEAVQNLQRATVGGYLTRAISEAGRGGKLRGETAARLDRYREALAEVLEPDQIEQLEMAIEPLGRVKQQTEIAGDFPEAGSRPHEIMMNMLARMGFASTAATTGMNSLIVANMTAATVDKYLRQLPQREVNQMVFNMLMDPRAFMDARRRLGAQRLAPRETIGLLEEMAGPLGAAAVQATQREED